MPGSIRSSTIRSGGFDRASFSASSRAGDAGDLEPALGQVVRHQFQDVLLVVNDQYGFVGHGPSSFEAKPAS